MSQKEQTVTTAGRHNPSPPLSSLTLPPEVQGKLFAADTDPSSAYGEAASAGSLPAWGGLGETEHRAARPCPSLRPAPPAPPPRKAVGKDNSVEGERRFNSDPELPGEPEMERIL